MKKRSHYRKILNSTLALLFVAVQLSMGFVASKTVAAEPASVFTELATHPQAAAQPTTTGKTISKMTVFNGKLIAGFGDYNANTGPIGINPFDIVTGQFEGVALNFPSESTSNWKEINGKLYTTSVDPTCGGACPAGYAVSSDGSTWTSNRPVNAEHMYDIATLTGTDLWLFGGNKANAYAWRSLDDGETWAVAQSHNINPDAGDDSERYYWGAELNGKMYMQSNAWGQTNEVQIYDGTNWATGTTDNICGSGNAGKGPNFTVFGGKIICHSLNGYIKSYDGTDLNTRRLFIDDTQFCFDGCSAAYENQGDVIKTTNHVYVLDTVTESGDSTPTSYLGRSIDAENWEYFVGLPTGSSSMAIDESAGKLYIGTTDSKLYVANLADLQPAPAPVDTTNPSLNITAPTINVRHPINDPLTITADASDNKGVSQVEFKVDGNTIDTVTEAPYQATFSNPYNAQTYQWQYAPGQHTITVIATDTSGNTTEKSRTVNLIGPTRSVSVSQPTAHSDGSSLNTTIATGGGEITCSGAKAEKNLSAQDKSASYPLGLVNFCLEVPTGSTHDITLTFQTNLKPSQVVARKYNSNTKKYANVPDATVTEDTIGGKHVLILNYQVTDGGELDEDGVANGAILDPVGLGVDPQAQTPGGGNNSNNPATGANTDPNNRSDTSNPSSSLASKLASTGDNIKLLFLIATLLLLGGLGLLAKKHLPRTKSNNKKSKKTKKK